MPVPIICLESTLHQYAESFRGVFSNPQFPRRVGAGVCPLSPTVHIDGLVEPCGGQPFSQCPQSFPQ